MTDCNDVMCCDHFNCNNPATHTSSFWTNGFDGLHIMYWCKNHGPSNKEEIIFMEEDE